MPDQNYYGDLIAPPDPSFGVRDNPVARGFAGALMDIARIPQRAFQASEGERLGLGYDPGPILEAATLPMAGGLAGVPMRAGEAALGAGPMRTAPALTHTAGDVPAEYLQLLKAGQISEPTFIARMGSIGVSGEQIDAMLSEARGAKGGTTLGVGPTDKRGAAVAATTQGIRAYHGSPYDFDRFDMSKIGTGEGAQAYGHGLYFAENPATAESYKVARHDPVQELSIAHQYAADYLNTHGRDEAISALDSQAKYLRGENERTFAPQYEKAADLLRSGWEPPKAPPPKMYDVNINADPEHFLDWDKPLSEQSQHVRSAVNSIPIGNDPWDSIFERPATLEDRTGSQLVDMMGPSSAATNSLRSAGIPGIKYLDQGSRGDSYFVSSKSPGQFSVMGPGNVSHGDFASRAEANAAAEAKNESNRTRNYVVFDDSIVDILRKYGLVGTLGSGITAYDAKRNANK